MPALSIVSPSVNPGKVPARGDGQVVVQLDQTDWLDTFARCYVEITDDVHNNIVWSATSTFKKGRVAFDLKWPNYTGHFTLLVSALNTFGMERAKITQPLEVVQNA